MNARTPILRIDDKRMLGGETPLHTLVMCGDEPMSAIAYLRARGADMNARAANGATPLWTALLWRRDTDARWALPLFFSELDRMGRINYENVPGDTPDALATIEALLVAGADPRVPWRGYTLTQIICRWLPRRRETLALLIHYGAELEDDIRGLPLGQRARVSQ